MGKSIDSAIKKVWLSILDDICQLPDLKVNKESDLFSFDLLLIALQSSLKKILSRNSKLEEENTILREKLSVFESDSIVFNSDLESASYDAYSSETKLAKTNKIAKSNDCKLPLNTTVETEVNEIIDISKSSLSSFESDGDDDFEKKQAASPPLGKNKHMQRLKSKRKAEISPSLLAISKLNDPSSSSHNLNDSPLSTKTAQPLQTKKFKQTTLDKMEPLANSTLKKSKKGETISMPPPKIIPKLEPKEDLDETICIFAESTKEEFVGGIKPKFKSIETQEMEEFWTKRDKEKIVYEPKYAYKNDPVRKKDERSKLPGWSCHECEEFYASLDLSEEELRKKMQICSRHKSKHDLRYNTPKGYWDTDFAPTQKNKSLNDTSDV